MTEPQEFVFALNQQTINGYRINSKLESARQFGKAPYVKRFRKEYLDLFYPRSGLILEFASDELMAITVIVSSNSYHIKEDEMGVGKIKIIDTLGEKHSLNDRTVLKDLVTFLDNPIESSPVGPDMVHTFIVKRNYIDTYHDAVTGSLLHIKISEGGESGHNADGLS